MSAMNKARIARIARLVALRQQQRRLREAAHAQAQQALQRASTHRESCLVACEELDREHDSTLSEELDPIDLDMISNARTEARTRLRKAAATVERASAEADETQAVLLDAYLAHRSLEMFHGRAEKEHNRELARAEQKELDELAQRSTGTRRLW